MVTEAAKFMKNNGYHLKYSNKEILLSESVWLNDNSMDSAPKLICKSLGNLASWQSVLNWQRRRAPFHKVGEEHIQLMHDGINHWLLSFNSNGRVQFCDSFYETLAALQRDVWKHFISHFLIRMESFQLQWYQSRSRKILQVVDYLQLPLREIFWKEFHLPSLNWM